VPGLRIAVLTHRMTLQGLVIAFLKDVVRTVVGHMQDKPTARRLSCLRRLRPS
jgi:hypothetical protein